MEKFTLCNICSTFTRDSHYFIVDDLQIFKDLQYSCPSLQNALPETLCQLDTEVSDFAIGPFSCIWMQCWFFHLLEMSDCFQAFLYATVFCSALREKQHQQFAARGTDQPLMLPASLAKPLCTTEQQNWWSTAYALFKNTAK